MKIGICDDNAQDQEVLRTALLPALRNYTTLECYGHGFALLESHCQKPFDILFLDIEMPHLNGLEVARELRCSCQTTHIIFVTQYRDYAAESYAVGAFSYLYKPFKPHQILDVFRQAEHKLLKSGRQLAVTTDYSTVYVAVESIIYAETYQHKLQLHICDQVVETRMTMQELTGLLDGQGFYRLHNSYLINLACVRSIQNRFVYLDGNIPIPIGKTRRVAEIKKAILIWRSL